MSIDLIKEILKEENPERIVIKVFGDDHFVHDTSDLDINFDGFNLRIDLGLNCNDSTCNFDETEEHEEEIRDLKAEINKLKIINDKLQEIVERIKPPKMPDQHKILENEFRILRRKYMTLDGDVSQTRKRITALENK